MMKDTDYNDESIEAVFRTAGVGFSRVRQPHVRLLCEGENKPAIYVRRDVLDGLKDLADRIHDILSQQDWLMQMGCIQLAHIPADKRDNKALLLAGLQVLVAETTGLLPEHSAAFLKATEITDERILSLFGKDLDQYQDLREKTELFSKDDGMSVQAQVAINTERSDYYGDQDKKYQFDGDPNEPGFSMKGMGFSMYDKYMGSRVRAEWVPDVRVLTAEQMAFVKEAAAGQGYLPRGDMGAVFGTRISAAAQQHVWVKQFTNTFYNQPQALGWLKVADACSKSSGNDNRLVERRYACFQQVPDGRFLFGFLSKKSSARLTAFATRKKGMPYGEWRGSYDCVIAGGLTHQGVKSQVTFKVYLGGDTSTVRVVIRVPKNGQEEVWSALEPWGFKFSSYYEGFLLKEEDIPMVREKDSLSIELLGKQLLIEKGIVSYSLTKGYKSVDTLKAHYKDTDFGLTPKPDCPQAFRLPDGNILTVQYMQATPVVDDNGKKTLIFGSALFIEWRSTAGVIGSQFLPSWQRVSLPKRVPCEDKDGNKVLTEVFVTPELHECVVIGHDNIEAAKEGLDSIDCPTCIRKVPKADALAAVRTANFLASRKAWNNKG